MALKFNSLFSGLQLVFLGLLLSCCQSKDRSNLFMVCGDSKVLLVDYEKSMESTEPVVIWTWDAQKAPDLPEAYRTKKFNTMDDCKAVNGGAQLLVSSSSGGVALLNGKDRKVAFFATVPNAHSVEMLPNDRIVAAASTNSKGNKIMLFDIDQSEKVLFEDSLYSAHGLVWHEASSRLFALGYDVLRAYKMPSPDRLVLEKEWKIPGEGGHDLQLAPGASHLYMTEHTGAWRFDIKEEKFSKLTDFPQAENIKSIGEDASGQFIFTVPEKSWWTHHVHFHQPAQQFAFPDMKVYKARWVR
ncbi:DUF6528 family protein [Echinicola vietnamensis]|uniref:Uncharacterized protein n=1 Tax=Echinicola vietnamensis (strain DSM 17526 / LMG 23754 / KMM 6221) TaxID=926556 RepID=L0G0L5_ECHVK|nr:DUF6528 family protein [Echinicola vietnamensis]AGA78853.1 hypothetical protein Echvi_2611 [Echinicola vietnamensis DSM 17526]